MLEGIVRLMLGRDPVYGLEEYGKDQQPENGLDPGLCHLTVHDLCNRHDPKP